jgi:plastocyanin
MSLRTTVWRLALWGSGALACTAGACATLTVTVVDEDNKPLPDAVLMLEPAAGKAPVKPETGAEIAQENKHFIPAVTVVPVGTAVAFPNRDTVRHHVYSFSAAKKFELKLYIGKPVSPVVFDTAGIVVLGCNIHDSMVGWVVVSDTPWYGKTDAAGHVSLPDAPAGAYRLRTWHPDLPVASTGVEQPLSLATAGQSLTVRLNLGGN